MSQAAKARPRPALQREHRLVLCALSVLLSFGIASLKPPSGLDAKGMAALAIVFWAVFNWVLGVFDDYIVGLMMTLACVIAGVLTFGKAFEVYSTSTWWLLVGVIGIGVAVERSGLLARLALRTLLALPNNFAGQCTGLVISGMALAPALAAVTGKAAIAARFVSGMKKSLALEDYGKYSTGLFMSMFVGFVLASPLYMTASVGAFVIYGLLPEQYRSGITWTYWLLASIPAIVPLIAIMLAFILRRYNPGPDAIVSSRKLEEELRALGSPSRNEIVTGVVLVLILVAWVTEPLHHVANAVPALAGLLALVMTGVLDRKAFDELPLSMLLFLGAILNIGTVLSETRVDVWIGGTLSPLLAGATASPFIFLPVIALLTVILRFVIVSYSALIGVLMVSLMPLATKAGVHPWVLGTVLHVAGQCVFFMPYQNAVYVVAHQASGGRMATWSEARVVSLVSLVAAVIGLLVATPVWLKMGLITMPPR
ncbi:MAG: anion permease [Bacillota bacterium]|nr:anion permease [Bacillota bacterium]